jgi:hypothetical protein
MRSLVGIAGGATRAALTQHQARRNNLADVSAKDGSQETLVNLTALLFSLVIVPYVSPHLQLAWIFFAIFTTLHVFANYSAVKSVKMEVFNMSRYSWLVERFFESGAVLSVDETNDAENVWFFQINRFDLYNDCIAVGVSLENHVFSETQLRDLNRLYSDSEYILTFNQSKVLSVNVSLTDKSSPMTCLEAVFQAILIFSCRRNLQSQDKALRELISSSREYNDMEMLNATRSLVRQMFPKFRQQLEDKGWDLSRFLISVDDWRIARDSRQVKPFSVIYGV